MNLTHDQKEVIITAERVAESFVDQHHEIDGIVAILGIEDLTVKLYKDQVEVGSKKVPCKLVPKFEFSCVYRTEKLGFVNLTIK